MCFGLCNCLLYIYIDESLYILSTPFGITTYIEEKVNFFKVVSKVQK